MEYIVSARKYRPMTFDTVVGQEALTTTLKNAVKSGKLAHAYLFTAFFSVVVSASCPTTVSKVIGRYFLADTMYSIYVTDKLWCKGT